MKLVVRNMSQSFGATKALSNVSFELPQGKIFGFVGPNGAGKTTLLRILSGIDVPDEGDAFWQDKSLIEYPDFLRREVGYMPDLLPSLPDITVLNYLDFYAASFGYRNKAKQDILAQAIQFAELENLKNSFVGNLSKGQNS
jgi:ABC-2 type transport system ATP-binding protein